MGEFEDYDPEEERAYWRNKYRNGDFDADYDPFEEDDGVQLYDQRIDTSLFPELKAVKLLMVKMMADKKREEKKVAAITVADRKAALRRQQEEIAVRLDRLERIPDENPFVEGDVFKLTKNWGSETEYTFVVLYVNGTFYTTGRQRNTSVFLNWENFINWAGEQAFHIEKATQWETIVE